MKVYLAFGTLLLACGSMLAQNSKPSQPAPHSAGMPSNMQMGSAQKSKGMGGDHMVEMQADMQLMKSQIDKLRADAQKIQDANTKLALLDNVEHVGTMYEAYAVSHGHDDVGKDRNDALQEASSVSIRSDKHAQPQIGMGWSQQRAAAVLRPTPSFPWQLFGLRLCLD